MAVAERKQAGRVQNLIVRDMVQFQTECARLGSREKAFGAPAHSLMTSWRLRAPPPFVGGQSPFSFPAGVGLTLTSFQVATDAVPFATELVGDSRIRSSRARSERATRPREGGQSATKLTYN